MSNILLTGKILESGNVLTPKGRLVVYKNSLFTPVLPRGETDESKARYQATLLFPSDASLSVLKQAVKSVLDEELTPEKQKSIKVKLPFLKVEDQGRLAELADEYPVMVRCNAQYKPDVVSPKGDRVFGEEEAPDEVYSGRWARMTVRAFWYDHPTGGKGVSFGLQNVQLLDHADAIAGGRVRGVDEFEPVGGDDLSDLED